MTITPRTISKETFCYVFAVDGERPVCYKTLWRTYIEPYLDQIGISEAEYRRHTKGLPYQIAWRIIAIHKITLPELNEAIERATHRKRRRRRIQRQRGTEIPFPS